jgi:hypothetical protein
MEAQGTERHSDNELSLAELLVDPMVRALMHADGITMKDVIPLFLKARAQQVRSSASAYAHHPAVAKPRHLAITHVGTAQGSATAPANYAQLGKAVAVLTKTKQQLKEAELRFDRDCGRDPSVLIHQVRTAERNVAAARAAVARLDRGGRAYEQ